MPDILVSEQFEGPELDALRREFSVTIEPGLWKDPQRLREEIARGYRAIIVRNQTQCQADTIAAAGKSLIVIGRTGVGLDNVDTKAATEAGIVVAYAPEQNSLAVAELALGLMLSLARYIPQADRSTHGGAWDRLHFVGSELYGKTLGLVGLGRIGFLTAMRARAFGMNVIAHDTMANPDSAMVVQSQAKLVSLDELLSNADYVSAHLPKTPQTIGMFTYERFAKMKPTAYFLNTSRGEIVDEEGLIRALREKRIAGCATDVRAKEPPQRGALEEMDNVILLPHIGGFSREAVSRVLQSVCRDVAEVLRGGAAKNYFNFAKPRRG